MSLFDRLREIVGSKPEKSDEQSAQTGGLSRKEAANWLNAWESGALRIPRDVHDPDGWDRYWTAQLEHGGFEQGFNDMMASDPGLIDALAARSAKSILCVGNGLSSESYALALHGFDVTVLDLSQVPRAVILGIIADPTHPFHRIGGFRVINEDEIHFEKGARIDPESVPPIHKSDTTSPIGGGSLRCVTGDLFDVSACPGPFDVVIERRTVQLLPNHEQAQALERLAARLGPRGALVSHQHSGAWRPDDPRDHFASEWTKQHGFVSHGAPRALSADRLAWLWFTTG